MSEETVQEVIIKAVSDPEFRELLFRDPDKALEGYELTEEEIETLKHIDKDSFDDDSGELDERKSRAGISLSIPTLFRKPAPKFEVGSSDGGKTDGVAFNLVDPNASRDGNTLESDGEISVDFETG